MPLFSVAGKVTFEAAGSVAGVMDGSIVSAVVIACVSRRHQNLKSINEGHPFVWMIETPFLQFVHD